MANMYSDSDCAASILAFEATKEGNKGLWMKTSLSDSFVCLLPITETIEIRYESFLSSKTLISAQ